MIDHRVANRYAKSLIELAIEKGVVEQVHRDMAELLGTLPNQSRLFADA